MLSVRKIAFKLWGGPNYRFILWHQSLDYAKYILYILKDYTILNTNLLVCTFIFLNMKVKITPEITVFMGVVT